MYNELDAAEGSGSSGGSSGGNSDEPLWYSFIVSDVIGSWAMLMTFEEDFSTFYLYTPSEDMCVFTPDWKTDNPDDGAKGFFVSDDFGMCSFVSEYGYTYASLEWNDETSEPISLTGPWGNTWYFKNVEDFAIEYPEYFA